MQSPSIDPITAEVLRATLHELKGPANRLRLLTELFARANPGVDDDSRQLLGHINDSASAVSAVVDGLKTYSEICARPLQIQPLDLNTSLESAISGVQILVTHSQLPVVHADPFLMFWVFRELLANSLHSGFEGDLHIHVDSGPSDSYISFTDNGPGIEPGMIDRIFRPFAKFKPGGGAGLGLTVCRKILEIHGGRIWAEERSQGAEFRFCVP
jgi:signal transduction histidine kinase